MWGHIMRRLARGSVLIVALFTTACAVGQTIESISWKATLDTSPDVDCVKQAITETDGVSLADYKHDVSSLFLADTVDHYYVNVTAIHVQGSPSEMGLHIGPPEKRVPFSLNYGYWPKWETVTDRVAQAMIANISSRCGVPELIRRVKKKHNTEWDPKLLPNLV